MEAASRECAGVMEYRIGSQLVRIRVNRKVYMPSVATILLARNLREVKGLDVLDLGTGSGILAILASKLGARRVVATDISRRAISAAIDNARLNGVDNIEFRLGSLYEPVRGEVFDLIICNPPHDTLTEAVTKIYL
ncbi:MAG: 50S ribosomal protein L11 methyltransferase, partial [Thaumarchaeota archaeon]|nr:50S ribosomal protein L11 methyltransferase [Nitrososphaerota archaeon]